MGGFFGPKPPSAPGPSQNEQSITQTLMDLFQQTPSGPQGGGTLDQLSGAINQGQGLPKLLQSFAIGQARKGMTPFKDYYAPERRAINRGFAQSGEMLANNAGMSNILGSDFLGRQAVNLEGTRQDALSQARGRARGQQMNDFMSRMGLAGQALQMGQGIRQQNVGNLLGLFGAQNLLGEQQYGREQLPFQQGAQLLGILGGGRQQDYMNQMQQYQASQARNQGIFGPLGSIIGMGLGGGFGGLFGGMMGGGGGGSDAAFRNQWLSPIK